MKATFTTHEIQHIMIAMISAKCDKESSLNAEKNAGIYDHVMDVLRDMNSLCNVDNGYTVQITATV